MSNLLPGETGNPFISNIEKKNYIFVIGVFSPCSIYQNQLKLTALSMANLFIIFSSTLREVSFSPNLLSMNLLLLNLWLYS